MPKKCTTVKCWQDKVWRLYSQYIKLRDCQETYFYCITCKQRKDLSQYQAGHYLHGKWPGTWLHDKNVHAQCIGCNKFRDGNRNEYALVLELKYGYGILQELDKTKHRERQTWTIAMLKQKHQELQERLAAS